MKNLLFCAIFICLGIVGSFGHIIQRSREIELHNTKIDTRNAPVFRDDKAHLARSKLYTEDEEHQYLMHFAKSLTQKEKESLEAYLGFTLEHYIPHNTYLIVVDKNTATKALNAPYVQWVGDFAPEYKIPNDLMDNIKDKLLVTLSPKERSLSDVQRIASSWIQSINVKDIKAVANNQIEITLNNKRDAQSVVNWVAQRPESHFIEASKIYESYDYYASSVIQSNSYPTTLQPFTFNLGFNGLGDIVGVADSGLKYSSCYFNTSSVSTTTVNNNAKIILYNTTYGDETDASGHGTAVCGIINGNDGSSDTTNGITPGAKIFFMDIQSGSGALTPPANLGDLFSPAFKAGANLFVAPFGAGGASAYGSDAASIDNFLYTNQDFLVVVPAGNSDANGANRSLSSLALSKNALVVGASMTSNDGLYNNAQSSQEALQYISDPLIYGSQVLASFSSRGPTPDGRIKPDVVAPGQTLLSASTTGACTYGQVSGTSYAASVAVSAAVIVRNYFEQSFYPNYVSDPGNALYQNPSAALVKAILINSGVPLVTTNINENGVYVGLGPIPSGLQGFGRIQLDQILYSNSVKINPDQSFYVYASASESLSTGQSLRYCFVSTGYPTSIKATLVWQDKDASLTAGHILVNDLDLVGIDTTGDEYRTITTDGNFDSFNNVEQVVMNGFNATAFHVFARNVPVGPQTYAVVFSGTNFASGVCDTVFDPVNRVCPLQCSGYGNCTQLGFCSCIGGRQGLDCSLTPCSSTGGYICAGNGYCDYSTSTCVCSGNYAPPDCSAQIVPPPPVVSNSTTVVAAKKNGITAGVVAGTVIAAFFVGAIVSIFLGGFLAVKYLEYRRDKIQKDRATKEEEMH